MAGSRATDACEPCQVLTEAALSELICVPRACLAGATGQSTVRSRAFKEWVHGFSDKTSSAGSFPRCFFCARTQSKKGRVPCGSAPLPLVEEDSSFLRLVLEAVRLAIGPWYRKKRTSNRFFRLWCSFIVSKTRILHLHQNCASAPPAAVSRTGLASFGFSLSGSLFSSCKDSIDRAPELMQPKTLFLKNSSDISATLSCNIR